MRDGRSKCGFVVLIQCKDECRIVRLGQASIERKSDAVDQMGECPVDMRVGDLHNSQV